MIGSVGLELHNACQSTSGDSGGDGTGRVVEYRVEKLVGRCNSRRRCPRSRRILHLY